MTDDDLVELAAGMRALSEQVAEGDSVDGPLERLVLVAVERVPGVRWASVSMLRGGRFTTAASTDDKAVRADVVQYEIGSGPCVDAVLQDSLYVTGKLCSDPRWSEWDQWISTEVGVNSVLAQRLHLQDQGEVAGHNLYPTSTTPSTGRRLGSP